MKPSSTINDQRSTILLATFIIALGLALPASAQTSLEHNSQEELQDTLNKIKASERHSGQLKEQSAKLEQNLTDAQREATHLALKVQDQERLVSQHEEKIAILETQRKEKMIALEQRRKELAKALSAMIRLGGAPKEAVIAEPGSLEKTLRTAEALGVMTQALRKEADSLHAQLAELDQLKIQIELRYHEADAKRAALGREQKKLAQKVSQEGKLRDRLYRDQHRESETIAELSKKSQSLQELLTSLENSRRVRGHGPAHRGSAPDITTDERPTRAMRMPVEGRVQQRFGDHKSRGILIVTRTEAQVVAPAGGEVVFTGPFMDYGRMVIIRHSQNLHTLLAGLGSIDVSPGDRLEAGEPVGRMGSKNTGNRLYLELRKEGRPVDPAPWFR